ncbi:hypothetical protein MBRA1_000205 [Malassezia brasiliensis]|uniref:BSD domain-containing protein n=1 Tax=Malassezia brasiliensis TaxID=1821822 RepID=A0AAF0IM13_9BASI|nr:hypothetical protein MBRA1_000205 [Malassezia brasiliensis]
MADEPYSVTSAATVDPVDHAETDMDALTRKIEDRVTNLVGGFSSWWSNVNQQSQSAFQAARTQIEKQGGLVATAKQSFARLEESMEQASQEARAKGREGAQPTELGEPYELADDAERDLSASTPNVDKGKQPEGQVAEEPSSLVGLGTSAWTSLQRLAHLPQVAKIQEQISHAMQSSTGSESGQSLQRVLHDAEALVTRYVLDGEVFARDVGKDLRGLLDDMVKIVPPEEAERIAEDKPQPAVDGPIDAPVAATNTADEKVYHTLEDADDFRWDDDEDDGGVAMDHIATPSVGGACANDSDSDWD